MGLHTGGPDFNLLSNKGERAAQARQQVQVLTGIRHQDLGHRAGGTEGRFPWQRRLGVAEQPALFLVAASKVIAVEVTALFSSRGPHDQARVM